MATLHVNGTSHQVDVEPDTPLLYVLRDNLGLRGPKFGCGPARCGSCTVRSVPFTAAKMTAAMKRTSAKG